MKNLIALIFLLLGLVVLTKKAMAQDTIISRHGAQQLVQMMYISGDTIVFLKDSSISKISSKEILKIKFENGNVTDFAAAPIKPNTPKVNLLANYPNEPIALINGSYFVGIKLLKKREVDKIIENQSSLELEAGYRSLKKMENGKTFLLGTLLLSGCIAASYLRFQNKNTAVASQQKGSNYNFVIGGGLIAIGLFTFPFHFKSIEKRKELVSIYNRTYYSK